MATYFFRRLETACLRSRSSLLLAVALLFLGAIAFFRLEALGGIDHLYAANRAFEERRLDVAGAHAEVYAQKRPESAAVNLLLARIARLSDNYAQAERRLDQCELLQGPADKIHLERALIQVEQGKATPETERYLRKVAARENRGDSALILEALAKGYIQSKRPTEAVYAAEELIKRKPRGVHALLLSARVHEQLFDLNSAIREHERALVLDPRNEQVRSRLGFFLLKTGHIAQALACFEELRRSGLDGLNVSLSIAKCKFRSGRFDEAEKELRTLANQHPNEASVLIELGQVLASSGRFAEAESWARRGASLAPQDDEALFLLRNCLWQLGKNKEAQELEKRLEPSPWAEELLERLKPFREPGPRFIDPRNPDPDGRDPRTRQYLFGEHRFSFPA
jgi:Tfp pilus assembly protein PilF